MAIVLVWTRHFSRFATQLFNLACISRDSYVYLVSQCLTNGRSCWA